MSPRRIAKVLAGVGALALLAVLFAGVWVVKHRAADKLSKDALGLVPGALLHAHNFHWTQMKGDNKQWELRAREASYSNDRSTINLTDADLAMTTEDGHNVNLAAPRAQLTVQGNHVTRADLSGGMKLLYGDIEMTTDSLTFFPDRDEIEAPGTVHIRGEDFAVTGIGLQAHPHARIFALRSDVNSTFVNAKHKAEAKEL